MRIFLLFLAVLFIFETSVAKEYVFGTYPSNSPENIYRAFTDITNYLAEKTGTNIKLVVTKDYSELAERVANKTVDIAWIGSVNYIKLKNKNPDIKYIATYSERSAAQKKIIPYYQAYIITLKSGGHKNLSDLKGTMFAFVDKDSTSGYAYPKMMLKKEGIEPDTFFKKVFFMKKHDRVIEAIVNNAIDAGAVSDGTYVNAVKAYGDIFTIIRKSDPIPLDAIVAGPDVPADFINSIKKALLSLPEKHDVNRSIINNLGWPAAGFVNESDSFYNGLRQALNL